MEFTIKTASDVLKRKIYFGKNFKLDVKDIGEVNCNRWVRWKWQSHSSGYAV